jgi:hypothetical protein
VDNIGDPSFTYKDYAAQKRQMASRK